MGSSDEMILETVDQEFDGSIHLIRLKRTPVTDGRGALATLAAVCVTVNGTPWVALTLDPKKGVIELSCAPVRGALVEVSYCVGTLEPPRPIAKRWTEHLLVDPSDRLCLLCTERASPRNPIISLRSVYHGCLRCLDRKTEDQPVARSLLHVVLRYLEFDDTGFE